MLKKITLGGGCFWCIESIFNRIRGVQSAISGFSGGQLENPTYKEVYTGQTGHAEVVQIEYDPSVIGTEKILEIYFYSHDPTQLNRQNDEDVGTHYRSVIFYHDEEQKQLAEQLIDELNQSGKYGAAKVVTEVKRFERFYPAEDYHQNYFNLNPQNSYCQRIVRPKIEKFIKTFNEYLKD